MGHANPTANETRERHAAHLLADRWPFCTGRHRNALADEGADLKNAVDGSMARSYNAQPRIEEKQQHCAAATIEGLTDGFLAEENHLWQRTLRLNSSFTTR